MGQIPMEAGLGDALHTYLWTRVYYELLREGLLDRELFPFCRDDELRYLN